MGEGKTSLLSVQALPTRRWMPFRSLERCAREQKTISSSAGLSRFARLDHHHDLSICLRLSLITRTRGFCCIGCTCVRHSSLEHTAQIVQAPHDGLPT